MSGADPWTASKIDASFTETDQIKHGQKATITYTTNIARRGEAKSSDETSTHIGQNITVEVWHHHHAVRKGLRVRDNLRHSEGISYEAVPYTP